MSRAPGFSLLELVVVLIIAGILAALALPRFNDAQIQSSWFHEEVKAAVRYAQRQAVAQRRPIYVELQAAQVRVCYAADCSSVLQRISGQPYALVAPSGVTLAPTGTFSFNGLGQPSGGQSFTVGGATVTVTAETGYVL